jgi:hypothetical protein
MKHRNKETKYKNFLLLAVTPWQSMLSLAMPEYALF